MWSKVESCTSRNVLLELDPSSCVLCSCSRKSFNLVLVLDPCSRYSCSCSTRARGSKASARLMLEHFAKKCMLKKYYIFDILYHYESTATTI